MAGMTEREQELFDIGLEFKKSNLKNKRWSELNEAHGFPFVSGEAWRSFVKAREKKYMNGSDDIDHSFSKEDVLYKEKVKRQDLEREHRNELRKIARYETLVDAVVEAAYKMPKFDLSRESKYRGVSGNYGILSLSDWHVGIKVDNFYNKFNLDVLKHRINILKNEVIRRCEKEEIPELNVLGLGDFVSGNIHVSTRVQQEIDVISQVMYSSELMAQLLYELSLKIPSVKYRSVLDNHSRTTKAYGDHIQAENFARISHWFLEERFKNQGDLNVQIISDNLDPNIGFFKTPDGKNNFFVHGHLDKPVSTVENLSFGSGIIADRVFMSHYHVKESLSPRGKKLYINSSMIGTDEYALNNRLFGTPSQSLLISDGRSELDIEINLK